MFTFSDEDVAATEEPKDFESNRDDDDDDDDLRQVGRVAEFNDELTMAVLRSTRGTFHHCAEVVGVGNTSVGRRQKRAFWFLGIAIGLVICK